MTKTSKIKGLLAGALMAGTAFGIAFTPTEAGAQTPSIGAVAGKGTATTTTKPAKPGKAPTTPAGTKSPGVLFFEKWTKTPNAPNIDYSRCVMVQEARIRVGRESKPPFALDTSLYYWQWVVFDGSASSDSQFWRIGWFKCNVSPTQPTYPPTTT